MALVRFPYFSKILPKVLYVALVIYVTFAKQRKPICKIDVALARFPPFSKMQPKVLQVALVIYVTFAKRRTPIC